MKIVQILIKSTTCK